MEKQLKLINAAKTKARKGQLTTLQAAQLSDLKKDGHTVKVHGCPKSINKGFRDTPLFGTPLTSLFDATDTPT